MSLPKITAYCPTLGHPELLARMICCFEKQTWPNRELVIIEDGGQLDSQSGDRWELVAVKRRFRSLAEKNNACIALASFDSQLIAKWDADDIYLPWALEASVEALSRGEICQPREAMMEIDANGKMLRGPGVGEWVVTKTHSNQKNTLVADFSFHGNWSYTRAFYEKVRGYQPGTFAGDDQELDRKRRAMSIRSVGIDSNRFKPFYFYGRTPGQISSRGDGEAAYIACGNNVGPYVGKLPIYSGEPVWLWPVPEKKIERPW